MNMVDERYELVTLVFCLAGNYQNPEKTAYQQELAQTFAAHKDHPAVAYAGTCTIGIDMVFSYACHLTRQGDGFVLIANLEGLRFGEAYGWTREAAEEFLPMLNAFYRDAKFGAFFRAHTAFFERESARFAKKHYNKIDLEWFRPYIDPAKLHCVLGFWHVGCGAVADGHAYFVINEELAKKYFDFILMVYCLPFAWPLAEEWYAQNPAFQKLCNWDIGNSYHGSATPARDNARRHVVRAYAILYEVQHGGKLEKLLHKYEKQGLSRIGEVYEMIAAS